MEFPYILIQANNYDYPSVDWYKRRLANTGERCCDPSQISDTMRIWGSYQIKTKADKRTYFSLARTRWWIEMHMFQVSFFKIPGRVIFITFLKSLVLFIEIFFVIFMLKACPIKLIIFDWFREAVRIRGINDRNIRDFQGTNVGFAIRCCRCIILMISRKDFHGFRF